MSGVRQTSRDAHKEHVISGKAQSQRNKILEFMRRHQQPRNRREIALLTGFPINVVTGRVNTLIKSGELVEEYFCVDPITNHRVWYVEVPYVVTQAKVVQAKMFEE